MVAPDPPERAFFPLVPSRTRISCGYVATTTRTLPHAHISAGEHDANWSCIHEAHLNHRTHTSRRTALRIQALGEPRNHILQHISATPYHLSTRKKRPICL